jgi:hypothetical protein
MDTLDIVPSSVMMVVVVKMNNRCSIICELFLRCESKT